MTKSSEPSKQQLLPRELTATRFPVPYGLNVAHAEKVYFEDGRVSLTPTAWDFCRSLTRGAALETPKYHTVWRWYMEKIFTRHRHWFVFDKGYHMSLHLPAIEATQKQAATLPAVEYRSTRNCPPLDLMLCIRRQKDLHELALLSPSLAWLSMLACGQNPNETWVYFLRSIQN